MKKLNQKGFETLTVVGLVLILALVGGVGYYVYSKRDTGADKDDNYIVKSVEKDKDEQTEKKESEDTIPKGYVAYSNAKLGLEFAHPKSWGEPIQINKSNSILTLAFPNTKVSKDGQGINGKNGYNIVIYANNGKQDFTTSGRGGAIWDCVGYVKTSGKYSCRNVYIKDGVTNEQNNAILKNIEVVKSVNDEVLLAGYNYFFDEIYGAFVNLNKDYYGVFIVTYDKNTEYKKQLKVLAETVKTR